MLRQLSLATLLLLLAGFGPAEVRGVAATDGAGSDAGTLALADELPEGLCESEEPSESFDDQLIAGRRTGPTALRARHLRQAHGDALPRDRRPAQVRARGPPAAAQPAQA